MIIEIFSNEIIYLLMLLKFIIDYIITFAQSLIKLIFWYGKRIMVYK